MTNLEAKEARKKRTEAMRKKRVPSHLYSDNSTPCSDNKRAKILEETSTPPPLRISDNCYTSSNLISKEPAQRNIHGEIDTHSPSGVQTSASQSFYVLSNSKAKEARQNRLNQIRNKRKISMSTNEDASGISAPSVSSKGIRQVAHDVIQQIKTNLASKDTFEEEYQLLIAEKQGHFDIGDPDFCCSYCNAILWFEERADKNKSLNNPEFSICCMKGKVQLPFLTKPPELLYSLLHGLESRSKNFKDNFRAYNSMFSFTSIGGKIERSINDGSAPPQFILSGQNYHIMGSMIPLEGKDPKFSQLYIYDTDNEISNRIKHFRSSDEDKKIDESLVKDLKIMIDENNVLARSFRMARDYLSQNSIANVKLRLFRSRSKDARTYNLPTHDEVAAIIVGDFDSSDAGRDIVVQKCSGELMRLSETHVAFIPLQYPLLFPYGEDGFQENILIRDVPGGSVDRKRLRISMREFIQFRIHDRAAEFGNIVRAGKLYQQFLVDTYTMVEAQRLLFIRNNQKTIRTDVLRGLEEALHRGETNASTIGKKIILPASFTGGKRYMFNNCQDAMAICKRFGYPDLFITITCNTNWPEIKRFIYAGGLKIEDRPDVISRVFKVKLDQMIEEFKKGKIFGPIEAGMYTIEFQKRGLPHAHILLWLCHANKIGIPSDIDKFICAEFPNPDAYPKLFKTVTTFMVHGPCGRANKKSPCMNEGRCTKYFPKKFYDQTSIDEHGYPTYRRRDSGICTTKKGVELDNGYVVPYNPMLLMKYQAHINVEVCNKSNAIKYLFKYVNKGPDRVTVCIINDGEDSGKIEKVDEIKQFYDCRYLSPCEAVWRIFAFDIHVRWPSVQRLTIHLPNCQSVIFNDSDTIEDVVNKTKDNQTMFLAWMAMNRESVVGANLTYAEFPSKFVYNKEGKKWQIRKQGISIGRVTYVPPGSGELFYMRLLLTVQRGCASFADIRSVNGIVYPTFQEACDAMGLLAEDKEFIDAIKEASYLAGGFELRKMFVALLCSNSVKKPGQVWEKIWTILADGILYARRKALDMADLHIDDDDLKNLCLLELEKLLQTNGRSLKDFDSMPFPADIHDNHFGNRLIMDELNYKKEELQITHNNLMQMITPEQRYVYNKIMVAIANGEGGFFFVYGYGGTGKTFIWNSLSTSVRMQKKIVLNVASSGIASLLLPGGRTAHSRFSIPLITNDTSSCNIQQGSFKAELLIHTSLIIWDEAPMVNKFCFEALDRSLRDIMSLVSVRNKDKPFGGKVVVLGGDFRQILPVVPNGSRHDIVCAAINASYLWPYCKVLRLSTNMRLLTSSGKQSLEEIKEFADWILSIGDGNLGIIEDDRALITIPDDLLVLDTNQSLMRLVEFTYPGLLQYITDKSYRYFEERAILAPRLDNVEEVNQLVLSMIPGDEKEYLSSDNPCISDMDDDIQSQWFTTEFLNEIRVSGLPNHKLVLKVGVPVMLLRNIDQANGLCNGTRLIVTYLGKNVIGAIVITGRNNGNKVIIPRMTMIPTDSNLPLKFERRQFPLALCFAMTINKSQGQSLSHVGLYLPRPVFTHGQLYVALSRVRTKKGMKILILDEDKNPTHTTTNVVYKEVFDKIAAFQ